ncbi:MAG: 4'-phosphopantetheinyl transferase superfamily protein [Spirochaetes bacterium]|nr:4'-phosphopantetheinyl transferase superfamily protein [Spirochaetota bacterium]
MNIATFNIGLSLLSSKKPFRIEQSTEGMKLLSLLEDRPLTENDILKNENGRPYFPYSNVDFNISHSQNMVAVSHVSGDELRTACDIQFVKLRTNTMQIAKKFFTESEIEYILHNEKSFFEIWTLKECFLKLRGFSVFDMKNVPSFIYEGKFSDRCLSDGLSSPLSFFLYELGDCSENQYMLAVCIEGEGQPAPKIKWFSQTFLPCRNIAKIANR